MKAGKPLIGIGIIILISGIVFFLQGQAVVGPESSFMYSNPEWITYGQWIVIAGVMILAVGIAISTKSSLRHPK
ncbi:MAG: hypothetical protein ACT4N1_02800 [Nitrososphaerota archaeon]